jgi:glycosyltransferase involved in cell wall biosynthesis
LGQIVPRKGIAVLVEALPLLLPEVDLVIVGGNWDTEEYARTIRERVRTSGFADRVQLMNHRTDVRDLLHACDLLVVPSLQDTLPRVIIEAMFNGVPVVAARVGAISAVVDNAVTGILVQPGDARSLAEAVNQLASSPDLRQRLGLAARSFAEANLRSTLTMKRYADLYRRLQSERRSRPERALRL